ncbi:MAG: acetyl-CoA carboxylase biotin carboxyl carrier protein subunit [Chloroflexota bacterium]
MKYVATINGEAIPVDWEGAPGAQRAWATVAGRRYALDVVATAPGQLSLLIDGCSCEAGLGNGQLHLNGRLYEAAVERDTGLATSRAAAAAAHGPAQLKPPIPGLIVSIHVVVGDAVQQGQTVIVLEAMKMQMELKAPRSGHVLTVQAEPRQEVGLTQVLLTIGD